MIGLIIQLIRKFTAVKSGIGVFFFINNTLFMSKYEVPLKNVKEGLLVITQ